MYRRICFLFAAGVLLAPAAALAQRGDPNQGPGREPAVRVEAVRTDRGGDPDGGGAFHRGMAIRTESGGVMAVDDGRMIRMEGLGDPELMERLMEEFGDRFAVDGEFLQNLRNLDPEELQKLNVPDEVREELKKRLQNIGVNDGMDENKQFFTRSGSGASGAGALEKIKETLQEKEITDSKEEEKNADEDEEKKEENPDRDPSNYYRDRRGGSRSDRSNRSSSSRGGGSFSRENRSPSSSRSGGGSFSSGFEPYRIVVERNIFDRYRRAERPEPEKQPPPPPPPLEYVNLTGAMISEQVDEKGKPVAIAFFEASSSDNSGAMVEGMHIAGYKILEIRNDRVRLGKDGQNMALAVGKGISKRGDEPWTIQDGAVASSGYSSSGSGSSSSSSGSSSAPSSTVSTGGSAEDGDLLQKLLERRKREMEQ